MSGFELSAKRIIIARGIAWAAVMFTILYFAVPVEAAAKMVHAPAADDPMAVHIYELDNGLKVYLSENHETPRFYAEIVVRTGSKHDPAQTTGLAHYLEHLLFKGTQKIGTLDYEKEKVHLDRIAELYDEHFVEDDAEKRQAIYAKINEESQLAAEYAVPNEFDRMYTAMGAEGVNAHTWVEETVYKVSMPSNRLEQWAIVEADRFHQPVFRLFHTELEVVYEEKNRAMDHPERLISEATADLLYPIHPYGQQTTLGEAEHLKRPSITNIHRYFDARYVPNNMAIIISGDIDIEHAIEVIDRYFSIWEHKELGPEPSWEEKPIESPKSKTISYEGEPKVMIAFRTAARTDKNYAATLEVLDMILDNSEAGLINLNLNQQQKVRSAGSYPAMYNDYGAQYLWGVPKDGQTLEEVEQLLLDQVEMIKKGEFEDWIIPAIINDYKKREKLEMEKDHSRVALMRKAFLSYQDWPYASRHLSRLSSVTKQQVVAAANRFFGNNYVVVYRVDGPHEVTTIPKPAIDKIDIDATRQSEFGHEILAMDVHPIEPEFVDPATDYTVEPFGDGATLYYAKNELNDLFTFSFTVNIGKRHNPKLGMAAMLLDKSGAGDLSAGEVKKRWYQMATGFAFTPDEQQTQISISGLDDNFQPSVQLLFDLLNNPTSQPDTLEELKSIIKVQRQDAMKDPRTLHSALYNYNRHLADSRYLNVLSNEQVDEMDASQLYQLIGSLLQYAHTISYTGTIPIDQVKEILKPYYQTDQKLTDCPAHVRLPVRESQGNEIFFLHKPMAQAQVRIELAGETYNELHRPAIDYYNEYFAGGMAGIVFQELRESRALAYVAAARYLTANYADDENLMVGIIGCQPDKTVEAVAAFIEILDNMPRQEQRFANTRQSLINQYRTSKLTTRQLLPTVLSWEQLGLSIDPRQSRYQQVLAADIDLLTTFHDTQIKDHPKLISIVGDETKIDMDKLAAYGKITKLTADQLFGF